MLSPRRESGNKLTLIRPSLRQLIYAIRVRSGAALIFLVMINVGNIYFFARNLSKAWITIVVLLSVVAFAAIWHGLYLLNAAIMIGPETVRWRNRFRVTKSFDRNEVRGVARRIISSYTLRAPVPEVAVVYGSSHRGLFQLPSLYWDYDTIAALKAQLGDQHPMTPRTVSREDLANEFPGIVSPARRYAPMVVAVVVVIVGIGLVLAFGRH